MSERPKWRRRKRKANIIRKHTILIWALIDAISRVYSSTCLQRCNSVMHYVWMEFIKEEKETNHVSKQMRQRALSWYKLSTDYHFCKMNCDDQKHKQLYTWYVWNSGSNSKTKALLSVSFVVSAPQPGHHFVVI